MIKFLIQIAIILLIITVLRNFTKKEAKREAELRILKYGNVFKGFIILLDIFILLPIFIVLGSKSAPQWYVSLFLTIWVLSFISLPTFFTFFVKITYDEDYIYYSGIKVKNKKLPWKDLKQLKPSNILPINTLVFDNFKIYFLSTLDGGEELKEFIKNLTKEELDLINKEFRK